MNEEEFRELLFELGIGNVDFFHFIKGKVHRYPIKDFPWACFPILDEEQRIVDLRLVVPVLYDEKSIQINIHEYTHAFELFMEFGQVYIEDRENRELNAKEKELEYLRKLK